MKEGIKPQKKTKNNEYRLTNKNMYSDQVYLPCEEYFIMNNVEVVTMIKKRPIDELFTILYIAHKPNTYMDDEIDAFFEDNGVTESCCMLLQLICNPFEEYQLNLSKTSKERRIPKNNSAMRYGYTPKSKYEEQKGYESDDDYSKNNQESAEVSEN